MIRPFPKPQSSPRPYPARLLRRKRVTFIGAFKCWDGAVLFADGQETVQDHGKWDVQKVYLQETPGFFRVFMTASGDSNGIEMIWAEVHDKLHQNVMNMRTGPPQIWLTKDI